ncbi:uncharacterized protein TNCV_1770131 [Trichonephila clavipes]|nr:uncharacterized protein TNCV_1770131 [Trichonephila clavipes]
MAVTDRSVTSRTVAQHIESDASFSVCAYHSKSFTAELSVRKTSIAWSTLHAEPQTSPPPMRHLGERMLHSCVMHRHTGPALGIIVWDGIGYHSRTPLVRIAGKCHSWFLPDDRHTASVGGLHGGGRPVRMKFSTRIWIQVICVQKSTNIPASIPTVSTSSSSTHLSPSTSTIAFTMSESRLPIPIFNTNILSYLKDQAIVKKSRKHFPAKYTETNPSVLKLSRSNIPFKIAPIATQNLKQLLTPRQKKRPPETIYTIWPKVSGHAVVTIGTAFQASIPAEVSACSEDGRFGWLRNLHSNSSPRCSMGFISAQFLNTHFVNPRLCKPRC